MTQCYILTNWCLPSDATSYFFCVSTELVVTKPVNLKQLKALVGFFGRWTGVFSSTVLFDMEHNLLS